METPPNNRIRLQRLKVENFKVLDSFENDFPPPRMKSDPDVFVFGSKNGYGKTSLLEAFSLLFLSGVSGMGISEFRRPPDMSSELTDLFVRAGSDKATIEGDFVLDDVSANIAISMDRSGESSVHGGTEQLRQYLKTSKIHHMDPDEQFLFSLIGYDADPLFLPGMMYFHSYRKVQEGSPELGMMVSSERRYRRSPFPYRRKLESSVSIFKLEVLRSMMGKADLFEISGTEQLEISGAEQSKEVLTQLNELVCHYAGGTIEKLRPSNDNTLDFRITPKDGGPSFAFDGLSSGQKEIISTMFLVWFYSKDQPSIVLIDEPELHLNAEWQMGFIRQLHKLAPWNQYIIATHSEDIFGSVPKDRRFLLAPGKGQDR